MPSRHLKLLAPIETRILLIRRRKVLLDLDLGEIYGVSTKRLNEQVKRNRDAFRKISCSS